MSTTTEPQAFLYDDFFTSPDAPGVEVVIEHRGMKLPFVLRHSLTLDEKQRATSASLAISVSKDGVPSIDRMDQAAYTKEVCLAAIKRWPFKFSDGKEVPINRETINRIDGSLAEKISNIVLGQAQAQEQAAVPFAMK